MMNAMVTHANAMLLLRECGAVTATHNMRVNSRIFFFFSRSFPLAAGCQAERQGGRVARQRRARCR